MVGLENIFYKQLVDIAYKQLKVSSIAIFVNAIILAFIVAPYVDHYLLIVWSVLVVAISIYRFFTAIKYQNNKDLYKPQEWENIFLYGLVSSTLLWSVAPFLFFVPDNYMVQATMIIIYAGLSAGAVSSLASIIKAFRLFLYLFLLPLIAVLLMQDTFMHYAIAFLVTLYMFMVTVIGNRFNKNYKDILYIHQMYTTEKQKLSASNERFEFIFESAPAGIFFYDTELVLLEMNQRFMEILGVSRELLVGLDLNYLPDQRIIPALKEPFEQHHGFYEGEYVTKFKKKDLYINMQTSSLKDSEGNIVGAIGIINDITEEMLAQKKIERQAKYDILTDIPNRLTLTERLEREFIRYHHHGIICALLFIDLDYFKHINDSLGHAVGDLVLIEIAKRIQECINEESTVARIGGDEFVVLLPDLSTDPKHAASRAEYLALEIDKALRKTIVLQQQELSISTSIGIALVTADDKHADDLLKHADLAMYQAKKDGRSNVRFYQEHMDLWIKRRLELENGLRNGLLNGELEVYYQPIVSFSEDKIIGAEALLRWNSKEFGNISPVEFIPIAEESGLIVQIGEFVLRSACEQFVVWQKENTSNCMQKIAVNISVRQFNAPDFIEQVQGIIESTGIATKFIELELVESIIIDDVKTAKEKMFKLRELGIGLSIDDFGTGYSSLSYLKKLPFTTLKIDRSFVKDITTDEDDRELIETILNIAKRFDLEVVAEGVEEKEHYDFLQSKGCDYFQGFLFSRAVDKDSFAKLLCK